MSYTIYITKKAESDILDAADYIEFTLKNPDAANHLLDEIETSINNLNESARRNPIVDEDSVLYDWGIRFLYGKSDWQSILKRTEKNET